MEGLRQRPYSVALEWGPAAIRHLAPQVDCIVVIDVMSFSSCVTLALERGAVVYPYPWRDESAQRYADERGAVVARGRRRFAQGWSLSPQSMLGVPEGLKLVLPSPNGSACAWRARDLGKAVYCAGLRNLPATAAACAHHERILVVPCGERWEDDDSLRPSLEDYVAAGGLVAALGRDNVSPEARVAELAYSALGSRRSELLVGCGSARELAERGFADDVALCLAEEASRIACCLEGDHFVAVSV